MRKFLALLFLLFNFQFLGFAQQNLVPNPSFEEMTECPMFIGDLFLTNWLSPTLSSPDLFHICNEDNVSVPQNVYGWQAPRSGNAYAGILISDIEVNEYREYLQCRLDSVLGDGELYEVSFYISRTDSSQRACDNIGAYLSDVQIYESTVDNLNYTPQVVSPANIPITDDTNWIQIVDTIVGTGVEEYLTLGVFTNNINTNWIEVEGGWEIEAHYYIDDVSVKRIDPNSIDEFKVVPFVIYPNPTNGLVRISGPNIIDNCKVYSSNCKLIAEYTPMSIDFQFELPNLSNGVFFLLITSNEQTVTKKIVKM